MNKNNSENMLLVVEIMRTSNILDKKISSVLKEVGITHVQFNILRILQAAHPKPIMVGHIKSNILFKNSDITRILDRLEDKGLINRGINQQNRRKMDVTVTQGGLQLIKKVLPKIEDRLEGFYADHVSKEECAIVRNVLDRICNSSLVLK